MSKEMSERGKDWLAFSALVLGHIENYTVPQYGDKPGDQLEEFSIHDIQVQLKRYVNRIGVGARPGERQRDMLKIAHYAGVLWGKV